ncbi:MAG TPA: metallopeptidase TldD-related protein [Methanospirillum sp.]|nr:metallopeptidase TldD-related protein [Methanospirillum sp.]
MRLIDDILRAAAHVADEAEIFCARTESIAAELKQDRIAIGSKLKGSGIIIRIIKDGKIGVSCTDNPGTWKTCLDAACASARFADPVPWKGLPFPEMIDQKPLAFDSRISPDPVLVTDLIRRLKAGSETYDAYITSGSASVAISEHTLANSNGLCYSTKGTQVHISLEMIAGQSTGYESDTSWNLDSIDPEKIGEESAFFAAKGQGGEEIETGRYDVVLSPLAVSQLLDAAVIPALSGRNVHTGRSVFAGRIGETVAGENISLIDDPMDSRGVANCAWDGEGMPVRTIPFIEHGVLQSFAYDLRTAYRYDQKPTASAVRTGQSGAPAIGNHNLILKGPESDILDEKAVFVHDLIGAHTANPMSGDFSVELSSPFFASEGALQEPIRTGMISGNIFDILHKIQGVSKETRTLGSTIVPSVRLSDITIIGRG